MSISEIPIRFRVPAAAVTQSLRCGPPEIWATAGPPLGHGFGLDARYFNMSPNPTDSGATAKKGRPNIRKPPAPTRGALGLATIDVISRPH